MRAFPRRHRGEPQPGHPATTAGQPSGSVSLLAAAMSAVVVLVGTSASGKTTLRRALVAAGVHPDQVVSLDDLRREARADDLRSGRPARPLQSYSARAVRRSARRQDVLAAFGVGYVADATHLRRRDRTPHLRAAAEVGLPCVAVLTAPADLSELVRRNAARLEDERIPADVVARQWHRRSLLSAAALLQEGFTRVVEP